MGFALVVSCAVFAALGGFLFGYDSGIISSTIAQPQFVEYFEEPSDALAGGIVSVFQGKARPTLTQGGAILGCLGISIIGNTVGRRQLIFVASLLAVFGSALQGGAVHIGMLIAGRLFAGIAVGQLSSTVPIYCFRDFQTRVIDLWVAIAKRYVGNPVIAGYNPLNEPADPEHIRLLDFYSRLERAIRAVDPDHMLFLDGITYAMDFSRFPVDKPLPNSVYACHDYSSMGFPTGQPYEGTLEQKAKLRSSFERKMKYMRDAGVPCWNGEFRPVYADPRQDSEAEATNSRRISLLEEQLQVYRAAGGVSWSIWVWKDVGYQGMLYLDPQSPYMKLIQPFIEKKQRLGVDFWGNVNKDQINDVYTPFLNAMKSMVPEHLQTRKYPNVWTFERQFERVVRECLFSEYLGWELAELFKGKTFEELEQLAASFRSENCIKRERLNTVLAADIDR